MSRRLHKVAIANRGEVAVRIIHACRELGIKTVLLHSEADRETTAYRLADEVVLLGPSEAKSSYLDIEKNILAAKSADADAIHPGFGFLSENADFAEACEKHKLIFIGPSAEAIRLFGDKISAKNLVKKIGGAVIPGYQGEDQSNERLISEMKQIGLPVMVKAAGGGGGRGLRTVKTFSEAQERIDSARREAMNAFGSDKLFLEKYLDRAKHIEFQIFVDASGHVFNLGERECSVQRRHQKIIEEAPSSQLDFTLRRRMGQVAVEVARAANYRGAGTVEFLMQDGDFYFMEMNTRLQVEHPVTEQVMGIDLVKAQIITAEGGSLLWSQDEMTARGHSIECRIYAEDPYKNGQPSTGVLEGVSLPHGPGRRFEIGIEPGDTISSFYDSMIAKVIVWDESRPRAIRKMTETLKDCVFFGVHTNIPYLLAILSHEEFVTGKMTTRFIETYFPTGLSVQTPKEEILLLAKELQEQTGGLTTGSQADRNHPSPWFNSGAV